MEQKKLALDGYVAGLKHSIKSMNENHFDLETKLTSRIAELEPMLATNLTDHDKNKKKIEFIKSHTNEINGKMKEILESINLMKKSIDTLDKETDELNLTYKECSIRLVTALDLNSKSQKSLSEQTNRVVSNEKSHLDHMEKRHAYLDKLKTQLNDTVHLNSVLASRYRDLKLDLYAHKINVMRDIEKKLDTLTGVKDKRQVKCLQERMHAALKDYYNYNSIILSLLK